MKYTMNNSLNLLNDNGSFIGFDIVIANPPYGAELNNLEKQDLSSEQLELFASVIQPQNIGKPMNNFKSYKTNNFRPA